MSPRTQYCLYCFIIEATKSNQFKKINVFVGSLILLKAVMSAEVVEAASKPIRNRVVRDDDSDEEESNEVALQQHDQKFFSPDYPLQHPQDDDEPLYCLMDKPYKYIEKSVGLKSNDLLKIIRDSGLSINEAKQQRYRNIKIHAIKKQAKLLLEESAKAEAAIKQTIHNILDILDSEKN